MPLKNICILLGHLNYSKINFILFCVLQGKGDMQAG